ncbi:hopanoid-associated sugar epimerase [Methylocystis parvus]|uniref:NAD-dependent epimerase/dehydratase family protein n=1 Tax=Methylocystis parvus TaxID=134 RepID=A0A6B8M2K1_9HYPH|nr:hopanoid-associated sugar epimerase [Methylocystis parvus]QGM96588.1 NAD-dependent epimerase/dehydratase family protein [Methylocystis parvus]WBJ99558.1 NAD-dependent epimerase/dehydratase family protein [Methylocystis parvus OBBP]
MKSKSSVLITGASGFIGGAVARLMLSEGHQVRTLIRPGSPTTNIPCACETVFGDITDEESVRAAMKGVRWVFHLAADYRLWARDPKMVFRVNVQGAEIVMKEAMRAGVERVVHTSSVATLGGANGALCTEENRLPAEKAVGAYKQSKIVAERLVETMIEKEGLPAIIVCPSAPLGPGDVKPTPTGRIVSEAIRGAMPAYVETGLNVVHVDDVAAGHLAAIERGSVGERYILGGENLTLYDLLTEISRLTGRPAPRFKLPAGPLMPLAYANEWGARLIGYEPFLHCDSLKMSRTRMYFDDRKARRELGYETRPARLAIQDAVDWFRNAPLKSRTRK